MNHGKKTSILTKINWLTSVRIALVGLCPQHHQAQHPQTRYPQSQYPQTCYPQSQHLQSIYLITPHAPAMPYEVGLGQFIFNPYQNIKIITEDIF